MFILFFKSWSCIFLVYPFTYNSQVVIQTKMDVGIPISDMQGPCVQIQEKKCRSSNNCKNVALCFFPHKFKLQAWKHKRKECKTKIKYFRVDAQIALAFWGSYSNFWWVTHNMHPTELEWHYFLMIKVQSTAELNSCFFVVVSFPFRIYNYVWQSSFSSFSSWRFFFLKYKNNLFLW